jgi:hypothetical protein
MLVWRGAAAQSFLLVACQPRALLWWFTTFFLQRQRLLQHLNNARRLVHQNNRLRLSADRARVLAQPVQRALLSINWAQKSDGPVQILKAFDAVQ